MEAVSLHVRSLSGATLCNTTVAPSDSWGDVKSRVSVSLAVSTVLCKLVFEDHELLFNGRVCDLVVINGAGHSRMHLVIQLVFCTPLLVVDLVNRFELLGATRLKAVIELRRLGHTAAGAAKELCELLKIKEDDYRLEVCEARSHLQDDNDHHHGKDGDEDEEEDDDANDDGDNCEYDTINNNADSHEELARLASVRAANLRLQAAMALGSIFGQVQLPGSATPPSRPCHAEFDQAVKALCETLRDEDDSVSFAAAEALANITRGAASPQRIGLQATVRDSQGVDLSFAARHALRIMAEADQVSMLEEHLSFWDAGRETEEGSRHASWVEDAEREREIALIRANRRTWQETRAALPFERAMALDRQIHRFVDEDFRALESLLEQGGGVPSDSPARYWSRTSMADVTEDLIDAFIFGANDAHSFFANWGPKLKRIVLKLGITSDTWTSCHLRPDFSYSALVSHAIFMSSAGLWDNGRHGAGRSPEEAQAVLNLLYVMQCEPGRFCLDAEVYANCFFKHYQRGRAPRFAEKTLRLCLLKHPSLLSISGLAWMVQVQCGPRLEVGDHLALLPALVTSPNQMPYGMAWEDRSIDGKVHSINGTITGGLSATFPLVSCDGSIQNRIYPGLRASIFGKPSTTLIRCIDICTSSMSNRAQLTNAHDLAEPGLLRELIRRHERRTMVELTRSNAGLRTTSIARSMFLFSRSCPGMQHRITAFFQVLFYFLVWLDTWKSHEVSRVVGW